MKLLDAQVQQVDQDDRIKRLELEAAIAQGRLMIAQVSASIRKYKKDLMVLQNKEPKSE